MDALARVPANLVTTKAVRFAGVVLALHQEGQEELNKPVRSVVSEGPLTLGSPMAGSFFD